MNPSNNPEGWGRHGREPNDQRNNHGDYGKSKPPPKNTAPPSKKPPPYSAMGYSPPPRQHGHPNHQQQSPYSSLGSYSSMGRQQHPQQQWREAPRDYREGDFRRHSSSSGRPNAPLCKFFMSGYCRSGNGCRFRHEAVSSADYYGRGADVNSSNNNNGRATDVNNSNNGAVASDRGRDDKSVSSDKQSVDEFGRSRSNNGGGGQKNTNQSQKMPPLSRMDSNRSTSSNKTDTNDSPDKSNFWKKIKRMDKPIPKSPTKPIRTDTTSEEPPKKKIKWGTTSTLAPRQKNYCYLPNHHHLWSECPENPYSKAFKAKSAGPILTAEESNAMCRAALTKNTTETDIAAAPPIEAKSVNSLYGNNFSSLLKQPPTVVASKSSGKTVAKSAVAQKSKAAITGAIPRRSSMQTYVRKNSSELERKDSFLLNKAAFKLKSAGLMKPPPISTAATGQKKACVPRSQRGLAKRSDVTPPKKRRGATTTNNNSASNNANNSHPPKLTSPPNRTAMTFKKGTWKKVDVPVAPSGMDAIKITKHRSTRMLKKSVNPFDVLDDDDNSDGEKSVGGGIDDKSFGGSVGDKSGSGGEEMSGAGSVDFDGEKEKGCEVICIDSSDDEGEKVQAGESDEEEVQQAGGFDDENDELEAQVQAGESDDEKEEPEAQQASKSDNDEEEEQVQAGESDDEKGDDELEHEPQSTHLTTHDEENDASPGEVDFGSSPQQASDLSDQEEEDNEPVQNYSTIRKQLSVEKTTNGDLDHIHKPHEAIDDELRDTDSSENEDENNESDDEPMDHATICSSRTENKTPVLDSACASPAEFGSSNIQQPHIIFTDSQIDEMEADLLDWVEYCAEAINPQNTSAAADALDDDESSVSDNASSDDLDDHNDFDTGSIRDTPQDSSSHSGRKQRPLETQQRSDGSSVTPSPEITCDDATSCSEDECSAGSSIPFAYIADDNYTEFYFCSRCHIVFDEYQEANIHEASCESREGNGQTFDNMDKLCCHMKESRGDRECCLEPTFSRSPATDETSPFSELELVDSSPNTRGNQHKSDWEIKYHAVRRFLAEHGHLDLPNEKHPKLGNLYQWLKQQEYKLRNNKLKPQRRSMILKLRKEPANKATSNQPSSRTRSEKSHVWDRCYKAVSKFYKEKGHLNLPNKETPSLGTNLSKWLKVQKAKFDSDSLSLEKEAKMQKLFETEDESTVLPSVDHLCSTDLSTGLPKQKLVVIDTVSETLHQFQTDVRPSSIPNSGNGVFLTYLGAKVLKPEASARSSRLLSKHVSYEGLLAPPVTAENYIGKRMTVTVKPDSLFLNKNHHLWTKKRSSALDKHLRRNSDEEFDEDVTCTVHDEVQRLRICIPEEERIGPLGINSIADYIDDDDISFWSNGQIELGRYGPFRPEDRKPELYLNMKSFLFDYEPNEWAYGIREEEGEMIDITDDRTGRVHDLARQHTAVYVNEVGHSPDLHENVFIGVNGEAVYYYISIDEHHAMKKGDTVELLVNYGEIYEGVRERKGYGLVNAKGLGGDAEDVAAKLQRNFLERNEIEQEIGDLSFIKLWFLAEFLTEKVYQPIKVAMEKSLSDPRHLIARRRLHWLAERFEQRLEVLLEMLRVDIETKENKLEPTMRPKLIEMLREWLEEWQFTKCKINPRLLQSPTKHLEVIGNEISEELFYNASRRAPNPLLLNPMDESCYSKIAIDLMSHSAVNIATSIFSESNVKSSLRDILFQGAKGSLNAVKKAAGIINRSKDEPVDMFEKAVSFLAFKSRTKQAPQSKLDKSVYDFNPSIPFGEAAALAESQAYLDCLDLSFTGGPRVSLKTVIGSIDSRLTLISQCKSNHADDPASHVLWIPRTLDAFKKGFAKVNEEWYLIYQVVIVVHALASCVDWPSNTPNDDQPIYSLEKLCSVVGVDKNMVEAIISQEVNSSHVKKNRNPIRARKRVPMSTSPKKISVPKNLDEDTERMNTPSPNLSHSEYVILKAGSGNKPGTKSPKAKAGKSVKKSLLHPKALVTKKTPSPGTPKSSEKLPLSERIVREGPDNDFPGWNVREIRRNNSEHIDRYWFQPDHPNIILRSRTGVNHVIQTMDHKQMDFVSACISIAETDDGKAQFSGTSWKKLYTPEAQPEMELKK